MTRRPQQPNRLTRVFLQMKETCPKDLQVYAACIVARRKEGSLDLDLSHFSSRLECANLVAHLWTPVPALVMKFGVPGLAKPGDGANGAAKMWPTASALQVSDKFVSTLEAC